MKSPTRIALVTGASRGIGRAIAISLAHSGYHLALVARHADDLEETRRLCMEHAAKAVCYPFDLSHLEQVPGLVSQIVSDLGSLDVLINNAGIGGSGAIQSADLDRWDACLRLNFLALMHLTHAAVPHLRKREGNAIITIGSIASRNTSGGSAAYTASKHAALGFTSSIFEDLRELGIKVSTICPGFVETDLAASPSLDTSKMISPEDVAAGVHYVLTSSPRVCPTEITLRPQHSPYKASR